LSIIIQEFDQQDDKVVLVNGDEIRVWQKKEIFAKNCIFAAITKEMKRHLYLDSPQPKCGTNSAFNMKSEQSSIFICFGRNSTTFHTKKL